MKDHGYLVAANATHLGGGDLHEIDAVEQYLTTHDFAGRRGDKAHHRQIGDRLTGPRFTDDAERFTFVEIERYAVHRLYDTVVGLKMGLQITNLQDRIGENLFTHRLETPFNYRYSRFLL